MIYRSATCSTSRCVSDSKLLVQDTAPSPPPAAAAAARAMRPNSEGTRRRTVSSTRKTRPPQEKSIATPAAGCCLGFSGLVLQEGAGEILRASRLDARAGVAVTCVLYLPAVHCRELEDTVTRDAGARLESSSAKNLTRSSLEHESRKPRQQPAVGVVIDFS